MTRQEIARVVKIVADEAWEIAVMGKAPPDVCLAIEALSDDPETCSRLADTIASDLKRAPHGNSERRTVRTSDSEWYEVVLSDGEAIRVVMCRQVWTAGTEAPSQMMSARVRKVIEMAQKPED